MGSLRILSHDTMLMRDRREAGRLLAGELDEYRGENAVVLGVPRGGVVVAQEIAQVLDAEMDILLARKLRTPGHAELAMGSVTEDGHQFLIEELVRGVGISEAAVQQEKEYQMTEIRCRTALYRRERRRVALAGRIVIVTDDGVATGATMRAALWATRLEKPEKLIAAYPVGPEDTIVKLASDADETICLLTPPDFSAVGQFYARFEPVEDDEVLEILRQEQNRVQTQAGRSENLCP